MQSRGVLYIVWGAPAEEAAARSIASLKRFHPELPHEIVRLPAREHFLENLLAKSRMMSLSPFEETLFLDADTIVLDRLDYGFQRAAKFGVACCICEAPWARRYPALGQDDTVEYNTGVVFFTRKAAPLFQRWEELTPQIDSRLPFEDAGGAGSQPFNDQCAFVEAVAEWNQSPFVLPLNWNFRPQFQFTWFGPIKVWHDYRPVPAVVEQINARYREPGALIRFHTPAG